MTLQAVRLILFCVLLPTISVAFGSEKQKLQSSYELMSPENQAMQDDPSLNPATFWVGDG
ncbi:hypothetical protein [Polynucleobacter necessarius]|uniref:hypothetical protein n=1 Tax=Polynucleobacter necessarius TaxID=576610 RepID=UPI0018D58473|nr:hypothetical protein [Polynucleobacter necessarius]